MLLIPAIDIKDGRCVRLVQGNMQDATIYSDDPVSQAARWVAAGAKRIHVVDLDGAVGGKPANADLVGEITRQHPDIEIQIGGGIRNIETVARYLDKGVNYVIIGTRAVNEPEFIGEINARYPGTAIAGIDVRAGSVATEGWADTRHADVKKLAQKLESNGAAAIVYTDIERDGMLSGVNAEATAELANSVSIPVIASGGIRDLSDIHALLAVREIEIFGAIAGKSLYEGTLDYAEATQVITGHLKSEQSGAI